MCASVCVHKSLLYKTITSAKSERCSTLNMTSHTPETLTQFREESEQRRGQSLLQSKQAWAELQRLLIAKMIQSRFLVKRKTWAAILPQRQHDNNMKNSPKDYVRLTDFHFSWLMYLWHPLHCSTAQASAASIPRCNWVCVFHEAALAISKAHEKEHINCGTG